MTRIVFGILLFALTLNAHAYTKGKTYKITVLHTNDHHGRFWPNSDGELGLAPRATLINQLREAAKAEGAHVLLLDAGDINTGVPQSDMLDAEPDFRGMGMLKYDAMAIGNHEFDNPVSTIKKQKKWAGFPFISANIYYEKNKKRVFPSHIHKKLGDLNVAIFGLTTSDTPQKTNPLHTAGLIFKTAVDEAKTLVPYLKKKNDIVIAVTHIGHYPDENHGSDAPGDVTLARQVNGIDLIVGGHTQKPLFEPDVQNGTVIVQAYEWGKYVGKVDFEFLDGKMKLISSKLIPVNLKDSKEKIEADPEVEAFLRPYKEKGDVSLKVELGTTDEAFIGDRSIVRFQEAHIGNLVAKAFMTQLKADVGIINSGGIRFGINAGKVTYESVLMVLPFAGEVVTAELTGKELHHYLEHAIFKLTPGTGSFPQISNVKIIAQKEEKKITSITIAGKKLNPTQKYLLAIPAFIGNGGDGYLPVLFNQTGYTDADLLKDYVIKVKNLKLQDYAPTNYVRYE